MNTPRAGCARWTLLLLLLAGFVLPARPAAAQTDSTATADSTAAPTAPVAPPVPRASWLSDRTPLRPGDLITVVVDEQTAARERVSRVADGNRSNRNRFNLDTGGDPTAFDIQSGITANSRDVGEAGRTGDLTAVLTVTVQAVEPSGALRIQGARKVSVDGRLQTITLEGRVRGEDVDASNRVRSSRIADAVITYKGGKIGPRTGIVGKILGMLWP